MTSHDIYLSANFTVIISRFIHVGANDIIPSPLICLLNSSLASHHLQGPVKTYEDSRVCPSVKRQQIHPDSPRGTLCELDKVPANSRGCSFSRDFSPAPTPSLPIPLVGHKCSLDIRVSSSTSWFPLFRTPLLTKSLYLPPVCHSDNQNNYPFPRSVHLSYATRITLS